LQRKRAIFTDIMDFIFNLDSTDQNKALSLGITCYQYLTNSHCHRQTDRLTETTTHTRITWLLNASST